MDSDEIRRCVAEAELYFQAAEIKPDYEGCGRQVREAVRKQLLRGSDLELGQVIAAKIVPLNAYNSHLAQEMEDIMEAGRIAEQAFELQKSIDGFITKTGWKVINEVEEANNIANVFASIAKAMREQKRLGFETTTNPDAAFVENAAERLVEIYSYYFGKVPHIRAPDDTNLEYSGRFAKFIREVSGATGVAINVASIRTEIFRARARARKCGSKSSA
jgi:hypothetical protein